MVADCANRWFRVGVIAVACLFSLLAVSPSTAQPITPFTPRFTATDTGEIVFVANTVVRPDPNDPGAINAQNGIGTRLNNNDFTMVNVDVDSDATTFNSSRSDLNLPSGATVLFAGLYWGADSSNAARNQVRLATPVAAYTTVIGSVIGAFGNDYQAFADVTPLVQAAGNGTYTVANVQATVSSSDRHGGWALVVVYRAPSLSAKDLTVFDGFARVANTTGANNVSITITGFTAPPTGQVDAAIGVVAYEGDRGSTGDSLLLNGTALSDPTNPPTNFFNSSISNSGINVTTKNPNQINQLGFDAATISTTNIIPNGATSATISLTTGGETYFPGVVATAIDLFSPEIQSVKSFTDIDGGEITTGDTIQYEIVVTNTGQDAAANLVMEDLIPANTTYVPGSLQIVSGANAGPKTDAAGDDQAEFDAGNNRVVLRLGSGASAGAGGTLAIGATTTLQFRVTVNADTPNRTAIVNQGTSQFTGQTTGFPLSAGTNESAFTVDARSDLQLSKTVDNTTPNVGDTISFTLSVSNLGPSPATGVAVQDSLPAGLSFVSASASHGSYSHGSGSWTIGTLASGATAQLVIHAMVTAPAATNTATASSAVQDPNPANNTASAVIAVQEADLVLAKTIDNPTPNVGDTVTFTLTLTSNGPAAATNVLVSDPLPVGLSFLGATPSQGTYDSASGIWSVGTLAGGSVTLTILAQVNTVLPTTNSAVASADQFDPDATNNSASVSETPQRADLAISKTVSNATPNVGETITYTVTVSNLGPDGANGVMVQDTLPAGVSFVLATPSQGAYNPGTGAWTIGTLANGATATLVIQVTVTDPAAVTNVASVSASDQFDSISANNNSSAVVTPAAADLSLMKAVSNAAPNVGDVLTYTLTLTNSGPQPATNVAVADALPAGLSLLGATATQGSYNGAAGTWTVGSLLNGDTVMLTLTARADSPLSANNVATVGSSTFDPDPADNTSSIGMTPQQTDLAVTKSVSNPTPAVGSSITFTVQISNNGPDNATNVVVRDSLPAGLAFVGAAPSQGTYDAGSGAWVVGNLGNGATATLTIDATVLASVSATNFATVSADQFDPSPADGTASATATPAAVAGVDIAVAITAAPQVTVTGDIVTMTVTATNNGPGNATGLIVEVPLPTELSVHASNTPVGTYDPATSQWTIGALAAGSAATLQITVRVTAAVSTEVIATKTTLAETDGNTANDAASANVIAHNWSTFLSDLVLDGTTTAPTVAPGGLLGYSLAAVNRGPTYVVDLSITGSVPPGTTFAGVVPSAGATCTTPAVGGAGAVTCTWPGVTMLDAGAKRTLAVGVRADAGAAAGSTIIGNFLVTSLTGEYYEPSNQVALTATVSGGSTADLAVTGVMQSDGVQGTALAVPIGAPTPLRFTVTNNGPSATTDARLAIEVPDVDVSAMRILGAGVTQGAVALTGTSSAEWQLGALAPGATATFNLSVAMQSMRATTVTMRRVESAPGDPASANDRATLTLDGTGDPHGGERWAAIGNIDGVGLEEVIVGAGRLETPQVRVYSGSGSDTGLRFYAYNRNFAGGVRLASCDVDADGIDEIITAPGIGPGPHVRVLRVQGQVVTELVGFYAFDPSFPGGVYVACADVDNDGRADVIASMGEGGSEVRVFDVGLATVAQKASFVAYESSFVGGARVASIATSEPGGQQYQIVTVPGPGRALELRAWALAGGSATMARAVPITGPEYQLGAFVDVADLDGDGRPEAVLATDRGISGLVGALTIESRQFLGVFQPYPSSFLGGVRVALGDIDADGRMELLITPGPGGRPILDAYTVGGGALFRYRLTPIELP